MSRNKNRNVRKRRKREKLFKLQEGLCFYCGQRMNQFTKKNDPRRCTTEHLIPKSRGGTDCWENVVAVCNHCNNLRGDFVISLVNLHGQGDTHVQCSEEIVSSPIYG